MSVKFKDVKIMNVYFKMYRPLLFFVDLFSVFIITYLFSNFVSFYYGIALFIYLFYFFSVNLVYSSYLDHPSNVLLHSERLLKSYFAAFIVFSITAFLTQAIGAAPHGDLILIMFGSLILSNYLFHITIVISFRARVKKNPPRVVILGTNNKARHLAKMIKAEMSNMEFCGFLVFSRNSIQEIFTDQKCLGNFNEIEEIVNKLNIAHVVIAIDDPSDSDLQEISGITCSLPALIYIYDFRYSQVLRDYHSFNFGGCAVIPFGRPDGYYPEAIKRVADIVISFLALLILSPLFIIIAVAIKLGSTGPVIYKSTRIGLHGRQFPFWKFRTMNVRPPEIEIDERIEKVMQVFSGEVVPGDITKVVKSEQITKIGYYLRKLSIDELPQLLSVLKGNMSLVGPRPPTTYEAEHYEPWQRMRFSVLPGITGLWQILARSKTTHSEMILIDLYYINNKSFMMDLEILIKTIPVVLSTEGTL